MSEKGQATESSGDAIPNDTLVEPSANSKQQSMVQGYVVGAASGGTSQEKVKNSQPGDSPAGPLVIPMSANSYDVPKYVWEDPPGYDTWTDKNNPPGSVYDPYTRKGGKYYWNSADGRYYSFQDPNHEPPFGILLCPAGQYYNEQVHGWVCHPTGGSVGVVESSGL